MSDIGSLKSIQWQPQQPSPHHSSHHIPQGGEQGKDTMGRGGPGEPPTYIPLHSNFIFYSCLYQGIIDAFYSIYSNVISNIVLTSFLDIPVSSDNSIIVSKYLVITFIDN